MNIFEFWSSREGTVGFAVTNMDWETFSRESHEFQCREDFATDTSHLTPKDFESEMRKRGYEITIYVPTEIAYWWCND